MKRHPIQPLEADDHGIIRFKKNAIVEHLLDKGGIDLNQLAILHFEQEEWEQFYQLIGYSLSGYSELSFVSDVTYRTAEKMSVSDQTPEQAIIAALEEKLENVRKSLS